MHVCGLASGKDAQKTLVVRDRGQARRSRPAPTAERGQIVGSYRLISLLGEGAVGRVYVAEHTKLGRRVALKLLRPELGLSTKAVQRFFAEARVVNEIDHENIVEITDFVDEPGQPTFLIMELLEGETLAERIEVQGALPIDLAIDIARQLLAALSAAHAKSVIHRDLKPENVFLVPRRGGGCFVKLLDFGVAKLTPTRGERARVETSVGDLVGTPAYMAPEQTYGTAADERTDVYAAGLILYEMVTGKPPFDEETIEGMLRAQQSGEVVPPSELGTSVDPISVELDLLILHCLRKKPGDRPRSADAVRWSLDELVRARASRRFRSWLLPRAGAAAAAGAVFGLIAFTVLDRDPEPPKMIAPVVTAPTPRIAAAPVPASSVEITFASEPSGADVFTSGRETALGRTPFAIEVAASTAPTVYEFRKVGFVSESRTLAPERDAHIEVALAPTPRRARPPARSRRAARPAPPKAGPPKAPLPAPAKAPTISRTETRNPFDR